MVRLLVATVNWHKSQLSAKKSSITLLSCLFMIERKKSFLENLNIFSQKNYTTIIRKYWATKYESRRETNFGRLATIFQICSMDADFVS